MRHALLALALIGLIGSDLGAQVRLSDVRAGQRVRVETTDGARTTGHFVAVTADSLVIMMRRPRTQERLPFDLAGVTTVQVSTGRSTARGVGIGLFVGLVSGVGLGLVCAAVCDDGALAPVGGLFIGPPIGGILGALLAPHRWRDVVFRDSSESRR